MDKAQATYVTFVIGLIVFALMSITPVRGADWLECTTVQCVADRIHLGDTRESVTANIGEPVSGMVNDVTGETIDVHMLPNYHSVLVYYNSEGRVMAVDYGVPVRK